MMDLVSIITPAYNAERYIAQSIESVINQDYDNWEMIIIDDCSSDNTKEIVTNYCNQDSRIRLISLDKNAGVANARNMGLKNTNGRFIAFLDSDDLWHENKLKKQIRFMKENKYSFSFTQYELIDESGMRLNKIIKIPKVVNYKRLLKGNPIACLTVMIDRYKINDITMPSIGHEDYATWLKIVKEETNAYGLRETLSLYRKASNSLSSNKFTAIKWTWNIYRNNQKLGFIKSIKCFFMYSFNAMLKYS